ncbi:hypothetical protein C0583_04210 [Candidatus Parcubacteria bacterium]|nr:MAG: hypothetical protein C0583_04210 [Candidatus Parcubacteria bacterium]
MHHLIFEGAELAGKSWLMSQVYNKLEPKYRSNQNILNGCHWFNADIGVFGTKHGKNVIKSYLNIFEELAGKNIIVEKLHISDIVYNQIYNNNKINYTSIEKKLKKLGFKIIFICFPEDKENLKKRIQDRLNIYPHYKDILKSPQWYINQQRKYKEILKNSVLDTLVIETDILPDPKQYQKILDWINE